MKKTFTFLTMLALVVICAILLPMDAQAAEITASGTCCDNLTWTLDDEGTLTISGSGEMDAYGGPGASLPWSSSLSSIKTVIIENGVTSIGNNAFWGCTGLTSVTIPDGVTSIGGAAFLNCTSLTSITIPNSVTDISNSAFYGCASLTGIWVNSNNPYYSNDGSGVLYNKDKTNLIKAPGAISGTYVVPNSATSIGEGAFYGCSSLTSITIPDRVTSIGDLAFAYCSSLTSITIPDSINSISNGAFGYCTGLTSITIPNSVNSIDHRAFQGCTGLTSVTIGSGVTSIGNSVFQGCTGLTTITIPDGVTSIDDYAFSGCSTLQAVLIPQGIDAIASDAFADCEQLRKVFHKGTQENWDLIIIESGNDCLTSATLYHNFEGDSVEDFVFTVQFKNWDGQIISTQDYLYGDTVTPPAAPVRPNEGAYAYAFAGWDKEVVACTSDATYTATYTPTYINYTVVFKDWNGNIISTNTYHWGEEVTLPATPTKPADNACTYSFAGWDKQVVACNGDATYTATYTPTYINYTVSFKDWNGNVISTNTYHWGDAITVPANPIRPDEGLNVYTFAGWDKAVVNCVGNATYTATYSVTQKPTGWVLDGTTWYYYDQSGAKVTGWLLDGDTWYYMNGSGAMQTGWLLDGATWYYLNDGGAMVTGWQNVGGTWYYFNASGAMQTDWILDGATWYYLNDGGAMVTGWQIIGGTWYNFSTSSAWIG